MAIMLALYLESRKTTSTTMNKKKKRNDFHGHLISKDFSMIEDKFEERRIVKHNELERIYLERSKKQKVYLQFA